MTLTEAMTGAAQRHEFRRFDHFTVGDVIMVRFVCHAGCPSPDYLTMAAARNAHARHQDRERRPR